MDARYVFRIRFRVPISAAELHLDPDRFETTLYRTAAEPGTDGWLFFRDNLWRGALNDNEYARRTASEALDVPVESVVYRALETDEAYHDALKREIAATLDAFNAENVSEVINKYLGSSVEVRS